MKPFVIFLRGLTPTGKNKVLMPALRDVLTNAGLGAVRTYIQSGNVIATSELNKSRLEESVHELIARELGADITVIVRTPRQIGNIMKKNPFPPSQRSKTYFTLLAEKPEPSRAKVFLSMGFSPDAVELVGDTLYTLYATKHSDSKFNNNVFEKKLGVCATTRNFNTMESLVKLSAQ